MPVYQPPEDITTDAISNHWKHLDETQIQYDQLLREALARMKYLEMLLDRYRARSQKVLNWQKEKESFLTENIEKEKVSIQTLRAKINLLKAFDDEFQAVIKTQDSTVLIGQEIIDGNHSSLDEVTESNANMKIGKANIAQQKDEKIKLLEETLKFKLEIEQNCIDFAKKLDQLNLFLEEVALSVSEPVRASSVKDVDTAYQIVNNLLKTHSDNKKTLQDAQEIHKKNC